MIILESNSLLPPFQFLYRKGLTTCDALLTLCPHLKVALNRNMEGRFIQLDSPTVIDTVSHYGLQYKMRSISVGGQFLSMLSEFVSDRRQCISLDGKVSASVVVVSGLPHGSVLGPLLFILHTSDFVGNHIVAMRIIQLVRELIGVHVHPPPPPKKN